MSDHSRIQFELDKADTKEGVLALAIGAASACWESMQDAGQFDEQEARNILHDTSARLEKLDSTESDWAAWFESNAGTVGGKDSFTAVEIAALLRGPRPFGTAAGE